MGFSNFYISFCSKFRDIRSPKLNFKEVNETYRSVYLQYRVSKEDIDKASFIVLILSLLFSLLVLLLFLGFNNIILAFTISGVLSTLFSYKFDSYLHNKIRKQEDQLNALIYYIKMCFSIMQKSIGESEDPYFCFIDLMIEFNLPLSNLFKKIMHNVQLGSSPNSELSKILTASEDFNTYKNQLLRSNFKELDVNLYEKNTLENRFKVYLKTLDEKLSLVFFAGFGFPFVLSLILLSGQINYVLSLFCIPVFLFLLNFMYKKLLKIKTHLIAIVEGSKLEKRRFEQFILFLEQFAINLSQNISPEVAFIDAFNRIKFQKNLIEEVLKENISDLVLLKAPFIKMMDKLKFDLKSVRYRLILETIKYMLSRSAYLTSEKIFELLSIINRHKKLEDDLDTEIRGVRIKVFSFIILIPIISGTINGFMPLFTILFSFTGSIYSISFIELLILINPFSLISTFITLLLCNAITTYNFLKIIKFEKNYFYLIATSIIYFIAFATAFLTVAGFF